MIGKSTAAIVAILAVGALVLRLVPLVLGQPWLSEFFVTEDGYLMLTVARNMAIGLGMTVSDGTIPTNGVQPLATFLFAGLFWLADGDRVGGLIGVAVISVLWSVAGAFAVRAFARRSLGPGLEAPVWPWAVAALWFGGPLLLRHTMNALETGLYMLLVLLALLFFLRILRQGDGATAAVRAGFGLVCGLVFLGRNDGAFLVIAIFLSWTVYELAIRRQGFVATLLRLVPPGLISLVVAAPWMIHNRIHFGSIVPISGAAQQFGAEFGQNLPRVPVMLFENAFPMLPVPSGLETNPLVIGFCLVVVAVVLAVWLRQVVRMEAPVLFMILAYLLFALLLCAYYGLYFGASHFLSRYLSPTAPLLIVASFSTLAWLVRAVLPARAPQALAIAAIAGLALNIALIVRQAVPGVHEQGHFQVVRWVEENLPATEWVGAVQTGTLGFWHDRTINLDGKVNPRALDARLRDGHVLNYVIESEIGYIADWVGMTGWLDQPGTDFARHFELVVADPAANLAVLRRKTAE